MANEDALAQYRKYVAENPGDRENARRSFYDTFGADPEAAVTGASQTAPQAAQRGAPTSEEARSGAADIAMSAIPTLGALGGAALTGGASIPLTALAAGVGGFAGKGVEMGLRTGTGIGAESVPETIGGRLMAAGKEGLLQSSFEAGSAVAMKAAANAAVATAGYAGRSTLGQALLKEKQVTSDYLAALASRDARIAELDRRIEANQRVIERNTGRARADAEKQTEALLGQKKLLQTKATEEAFRIRHIEAANESVERALAQTGAATPGVGQTVAAHGQQMGGIVRQFENDTFDNLIGGFIGLEQAAVSLKAPPVDVRPIFKSAAERIDRIPKMPGSGQQFTELNETLATLRKHFDEFGKGKIKAEAAPVDPASGTVLGQSERRIIESIDAVDKNANLGGLLRMRGGLSQEIAKLKAAGTDGKRAAAVLEPLLGDTDKLIDSTMGRMGWTEGQSTFKALKDDWAAASRFREQQAFQLLKKAPERAYELLDATSGYTPVVKKVLQDTGAYEAMWPEIRRQWIANKFVRNGKLDTAAFLEGVRSNEPILNEIFDTPQAQAQLRRLRLGAARMEKLTGNSFKGVADYSKMETFKDQLLKIGEEIAAVETKAQRTVDEIMQKGASRDAIYRDKLARASGEERAALKEAYERKMADLGIATGRMERDLLGPVPRMLMSRGMAGAVMGAAAGQSITGALGGLAAGIALQRGEAALTRRLIHLSENPERWTAFVDAVNKFSSGQAPRAAQALRASILGYKAGRVTQELVSAHEPQQ
jgi:hypothetical protein